MSLGLGIHEIFSIAVLQQIVSLKNIFIIEVQLIGNISFRCAT